jgi:hypothetical protein
MKVSEASKSASAARDIRVSFQVGEFEEARRRYAARPKVEHIGFGYLARTVYTIERQTRWDAVLSNGVVVSCIFSGVGSGYRYQYPDGPEMRLVQCGSHYLPGRPPEAVLFRQGQPQPHLVLREGPGGGGGAYSTLRRLHLRAQMLVSAFTQPEVALAGRREELLRYAVRMAAGHGIPEPQVLIPMLGLPPGINGVSPLARFIYLVGWLLHDQPPRVDDADDIYALGSTLVWASMTTTPLMPYLTGSCHFAPWSVVPIRPYYDDAAARSISLLDMPAWTRPSRAVVLNGTGWLEPTELGPPVTPLDLVERVLPSHRPPAEHDFSTGNLAVWLEERLVDRFCDSGFWESL